MEERRSDKHGPMLDDELDHEAESFTNGAPVESRSEEAREKEGPSVGEPTPDARITGDRGLSNDHGLSPDEAERRAELARWVQPAAFPADREQLLASARDLEAPEPVLATLARLPEDVEFANIQAVWVELGGSWEERV